MKIWLPESPHRLLKRVLVCLLLSLLVLFQATSLYQVSAAELFRSSNQNGGLVDVSCVNDYCMAVGVASYETDVYYERPMAAERKDDTWTMVVEPRLYQDNASGFLSDVKCWAVAQCMAIGLQTDQNGRRVGWIAGYYAGEWRSISFPSEYSVIPTEIDCNAQGSCVIAGVRPGHQTGESYPQLFLVENNTVNSIDLSYLSNEISAISGISCVGLQCLLVGHKSAQTVVKHEIVPAAMWFAIDTQMIEPQPVPATLNASFGAAQCSNINSCTYTGNVEGYGRPFVFWPSMTDSLEAYELSPDGIDKTPQFNDISCWNTQQCFVGGVVLRGDSSNIYRNESVIYDVSDPNSITYTTVFPDSPYGSFLYGIDCVQEKLCVAAGSFLQNSNWQQRPFLVEYSGGQWQLITPAMNSGGPQDTTGRPAFVVFGDSITTGSSIVSCKPERAVSPWGCTTSPAVTPYSNRVAEALGYQYDNQPIRRRDFEPGWHNRVGIWGYTANEAAGSLNGEIPVEGDWVPQLAAVEEATELVVGALGINDLEFSNVVFWLREYLHPSGNKVAVTAQQKIKDREHSFDQVFESLDVAHGNGARVILMLYYNPYDTDYFLCSALRDIAEDLVGTLNTELSQRADIAGFDYVDLRSTFRGHGAGSEKPYVFGTQCKITAAVTSWIPKWLGGGGGTEAVAETFDPHPNNAGNEAIKDVILERYYQ